MTTTGRGAGSDRVSRIFAGVVLSTVVLAVACTAGSDDAAPPSSSAPVAARTVEYVPLDPAVFTPEAVIDGWLAAPGGPDVDAIDTHAWEIWAALNASTDQTLHGTPLPVWETWFADAEVFLDAPETINVESRDLGLPTQQVHAGSSPMGDAAGALSFNRYNEQMADHLSQNRYYDASVLDELSRSLDDAAVPVAQRTVADFPNTAVMVKPVFWIVPGDAPSMMPYWAGDGPDASTSDSNPDWMTWRQCVLVDPTGEATADEARTCNAGQAGREDVEAGAYDVKRIDEDPAQSDFYAIRLTQDEVDGLAQYKMILDNSNVKDELQEVEAGDYALLVAMHVSTREIANWTWQTFWWTPTPDVLPDSPPGASAAPDTVPVPFDQFHSCNAYLMVEPTGAPSAGAPHVCFNPYLETNLTGLLTLDKADDTEVGKHSNCMSCHFVATYPKGDVDYLVHGEIAADDPVWFTDDVRTQFSWAMAFRAHEGPFVAPGAPVPGSNLTTTTTAASSTTTSP